MIFFFLKFNGTKKSRVCNLCWLLKQERCIVHNGSVPFTCISKCSPCFVISCCEKAEKLQGFTAPLIYSLHFDLSSTSSQMWPPPHSLCQHTVKMSPSPLPVTQPSNLGVCFHVCSASRQHSEEELTLGERTQMWLFPRRRRHQNRPPSLVRSPRSLVFWLARTHVASPPSSDEFT